MHHILKFKIRHFTFSYGCCPFSLSIVKITTLIYWLMGLFFIFLMGTNNQGDNKL